MPISPITFALVSGIGGGCVGIPLLLWKNQTNGLGSPKTHSQTTLTPSPSSSDTSGGKPTQDSSPSKNAEQGNCQVIQLLGNSSFENILWNQGRERDDYIAISCQSTNSTPNDKIPNDWKGLFPSHLLLNSYNLKPEMKFDIATQTELLGDSETGSYKTTFSGNRIVVPIVGKWKEQPETIAERSVIVVDVLEGDLAGDSKDSDPVYLLFDNNN